MGGVYKFRNEQLSFDSSLNGKIDGWVQQHDLFDRRYYSGLFSPQWNNRYGEPRSLMFTLKADF
nr:hypothetical protein [uncultured Moellerella sp.]